MLCCVELLTVTETAGLLKAHPKTVERWIRAGVLPALRVGREWRINRLTLERWVVEKEKGHFLSVDSEAAPNVAGSTTDGEQPKE